MNSQNQYLDPVVVQQDVNVAMLKKEMIITHHTGKLIYIYCVHYFLLFIILDGLDFFMIIIIT